MRQRPGVARLLTLSFLCKIAQSKMRVNIGDAFELWTKRSVVQTEGSKLVHELGEGCCFPSGQVN